MFDNILHQEEAIASLERAVRAGELPGALLFSGPRCSGKTTAALELARVLSCERGTAEWNCPCRACESHRALVSPDLALLGSAPFVEEIGAALSTLGRADARERERILFLRAVRKLTLRFSPQLWAGEESRLSKIAPSLLSVNELVGEFEGSEDAEGRDRLAAKIAAECGKLAEAVPDAIPVFQVRALAFWSRLKPQGRKKVAVVAGAEHMAESARNAFLKVLEEPPENCVFILTAERRGAVMRTILSRLRAVPFRERDEKGANDVLERVFRAPPSPDGIRGYLESFGDEGTRRARALAAAFLSGVVSRAVETRKVHPAFALTFPDAGERVTPASVAKALGGREAFPAFLDALAEGTRRLIREAGDDARVAGTAARWNAAFREAKSRATLFNVQAQAALEYLQAALGSAL